VNSRGKSRVTDSPFSGTVRHGHPGPAPGGGDPAAREQRRGAAARGGASASDGQTMGTRHRPSRSLAPLLPLSLLAVCDLAGKHTEKP